MSTIMYAAAGACAIWCAALPFLLFFVIRQIIREERGHE